MKSIVTVLAVVLAVGCSEVQNVSSTDHLKTATLQAIGAERVAWLTNGTTSLPRGVGVVDLKTMRVYIDNIDAKSGTSTVTYKYVGTFATADGRHDGTITVQRRLHFTKSDSGTWSPSGAAEEVASNASWNAGRSAL